MWFHSWRRLRVAAPLLLLALASCGDGYSTAPGLRALAQARERWARTAPAAYQITVSRGCYCLLDATRPVIVVVRDGQVESRRYEDTGVAVVAELAGYYPTVEGMFDLIEAAIARGAVQVEASFDATRGFPIEIALDESATMVDDDLRVSTRDFAER